MSSAVTVRDVMALMEARYPAALNPNNPELWTEIRRHPAVGYQIVRRVPFLRNAADILLVREAL